MGINTITPIKTTLGMSMLKYDYLNELFSGITIKEDTVVFHIDLYSIICRCYTNTFLDKLDRADRTICLTDFVVSILTVLGHYRFYTVKRLKKRSYIILTYNSKLTKYQKSLYKDYRWDRLPAMDMEDKIYGHMNKMISEAYRMVQTVCTYIEGIYVIDQDCGIDTIGAVSLFQNYQKFQNAHHIVFSRLLSAIQLIRDDTEILYQQGNHTMLLSKKNYTEAILRKCKGPTKEKLAKMKLPVSLYQYVCILGGCEHILKSMNKRTGMPEAFKTVADMLNDGYITEQVSFPVFMEQLEKYRQIKNNINDGVYYSADQYNTIIDRYRVLNVSLNIAALTKAQITTIFRRIVDIYNQKYLDDLTDLLSKLNDPDRLIDFNKLNAQITDDAEYQGEWW